MTTEQLIKWAKDAQKKRKESWNENTEDFNLTLAECTKTTAPITPELMPEFEVEYDLVRHLLNTYWHELEEIEL